MSPVIYDVILHNFNKVVKEKYGNKLVKVSELPWRDWWRECGARPVGQNNVAGHLALRPDMFKKTITYDEFPFLDDITGVTVLTLTFCKNVDYSAFPKVKWISHITLGVDGDSVMDISQLQAPLGNIEANTNTAISVGDSCKIIGRIVLQKFKGCVEAPLANNEATFIIPNGRFQYFNSKYNTANYMVLDNQSKLPYIEAESIELLTSLFILDKNVFINHFKSNALWLEELYFSDENKTIFNDGKYEKITLDYYSLNGSNPYDVLISFNGEIKLLPVINGNTHISNMYMYKMKELFKKYNLTYYTQSQLKEAIDSAVNMRQATALTGGF